jgi:hypothetical protein
LYGVDPQTELAGCAGPHQQLKDPRLIASWLIFIITTTPFRLMLLLDFFTDLWQQKLPKLILLEGLLD